MNNAERRRIVQEAKLNGYQGSYVDLFRQAAQNPDSMQKPLFSAVTPEEKEQGLRPLHEAGRTDASMAFPDVPPNTPFNTVGMKAPIDIKKYDKQGHLVKSYENVPPGIQNLDTGPNVGTVLETPSRMQEGGPKEDYNMARAKELGYKPDETGHYPSVDYETGMLLKSKEHPTVKLEFMSQMLSPERKMIANPTGYFGENQLQYVPRNKKQTGGDTGGADNPGQYMNEMEPKVFPNQKRDAKWVNYATQHDFAGRFPGETRTNREIGLERSNRNTVPLPPNPVRPKELKRAQEGATRQDSLDIYNNSTSILRALKNQGYDVAINSFPTTGKYGDASEEERRAYVNQVEGFYNDSFGDEIFRKHYDDWIATGEWKKYYDEPPSYLAWTGRTATLDPIDKNRVRTREMSARSINMDIPPQLLDKRIKPQGFVVAQKTIDKYKPDEHNWVDGYDNLKPHKDDDLWWPNEFVLNTGDTIFGVDEEDAKKEIEYRKGVDTLPKNAEIVQPLYYNIADLVGFPYYDPLMVKPYDMLTDEEKKQRREKEKQYKRTEINKTISAGPQRPRVDIPDKMKPRLPISPTPELKTNIIQGPHIEEQRIMYDPAETARRAGFRGAPSTPYEIGVKRFITYPDGKTDVRKEMFDKEHRDINRKKTEPIVTPKISFQTGGPKAGGGDPTEDKPVLDAFMMEKFMAEKKGGEPETWRAVADTIGYHESGPWGRMDPKAVQVPSGIGRGIFQFETTDSESFKTAQQRHRNMAKAMGVKPDPGILKANSADELSREQQYLLFYGNLYESPAKLADYTSGKLPLVDLWLQGHKRKEAEGDRKAFEHSRLDAKRNLRNYPSIGIAPSTTAKADATRTVSPQLQAAFDILKRDN